MPANDPSDRFPHGNSVSRPSLSHSVLIFFWLLLACGVVKGQEKQEKPLSEYELNDTYRSHSQVPKKHNNPEKYHGYGISSGVWVPRGNSRLALGVHPTFGIMLDGWSGNFVFDLVLDFRFGKAEHKYKVKYMDSTEWTDHYLGGYLGFQTGYAFLNTENTSAYFLAGMGLDGFDAIEEDYYHEKPLSINVFNKNFGFGVRHFYKDVGFFGVELVYNFVNYRNPGGTPLDGNCISVRLIFGRVRMN